MPSKVYSFTRYDEVVLPAEAFNRRVQFQAESTVTDPAGGVTNVWATVLTTWAHLEPWKGIERFFGGQIYPNMWMRALLRYRPSFNYTASLRMVYGAHIYNIRAIWVPAEAQRIIELLAEEMQAHGTTQH